MAKVSADPFIFLAEPDLMDRPQPHNYEPSSSVALAVLGSLDLEFTRLSQITRDPKYFQATEQVTDQIQMWQNRTSLCGMLLILVDATGPSGIQSFPSSTYSLGALSDFAYEYLVKVSSVTPYSLVHNFDISSNVS